MNHHDFNQIILILLLGVGAQWIAWRMRLPSILLLLATGLLIGPAFGWLNPDTLLGDLLFPVVNISVAVILFEGGLSLRIADLPKHGGVVRNLVTVGALVSWLGIAAAARFLLAMPLPMALLIGAILTVTGPTVIGPLLRSVRPRGELGSVVKWEGILIDPIGAALSVLVFEQLLSGGAGAGPAAAAFDLLKTLLIGGFTGFVAAAALYLLVRYERIPDFLENAVSLGLVAGALFAADFFQQGAGLLAVTLMGVLLANQSRVPVRRIAEFKENLRLLLISTLFILLSARIEQHELLEFTWKDGVFVATLILIVRPLSVWISTLGSDLNWREKVLVSWLAPRGIVAAAVSSVFAFPLMAAGVEGADRLAPLVFLVIVATVMIYGLTAAPLAKRLRLSEADPQGVLIIGAHGWARALAKQVHELGARVLLVDRNPQNIKRARRIGLDAHEGDILAENLSAELGLNGIGQMIALTANDEVNTLACVRFSQIFGDRGVFQLVPSPGEMGVRQPPARKHGYHGRWIFYDGCRFDSIAEEYANGARFEIAPDIPAGALEAMFASRPKQTPLFVRRSNGKLTPFTCDDPPSVRGGETLLLMRVSSRGALNSEAE